MARPLKSFAEMSLKVVAVRTADNSDFEFEFPPRGPQLTPSDLIPPLEQPMQLRRDFFRESGAWRHGGLNE